jgi:peptide/nickel transport system substrate-binding protein
MAGTVVDNLMTDAAGAAIAPRIKRGNKVTVAVASTPSSIPLFNGWAGKLDAAGFYVASAIFDPLFYNSATGVGYLPGLATKAVPSNGYKTWTLTLRNNVKFHDNTPFNAANVVNNYAKRSTTVKLAITGIIDNVVATGPMTVQFKLHIAYFTFPYSLAEQQITFMAANAQLNGGTTPLGTGAFKVHDWVDINHPCNLVANPNYWRKDATGGKLPYLSALTFTPIIDETARQSALQTKGVDISPFYNGTVIKQNRTNAAFVKVDDIGGLREPAKNLILCNMRHATSPIKDVRIRTALAHAINRATYFSGIDSSLGAVADGIFRKTNPYYANPNYPGFSTGAAVSLVNSWKTSNGGKTPVVVMSYISGSSVADAQYAFVKNAASSCGITLNYVKYLQDQLITEVIFKNYEVAGWAQFGAIVPATLYVWWASPGGLPNFVNFAQQSDPLVQSALIKALAASTVAAQKTYWQTVNNRFAIDLPYLWLDTTSSQWASRNYVMNWAQPKVPATGTSPKSTANALSVHNGNIIDFSQVWHN